VQIFKKNILLYINILIMSDVGVIDCNKDNDCLDNYFCSFSEDSLKHNCISSNKDNLYYGCLNKDIKNSNLEIVQSKSNIDQKDFKNCVNFSRRQKNKDDISHNYMIYKEQKSVFVDTTTINIYLKCGDQILSVIPYIDYFNISCYDNQRNCLLLSKNNFKNFVIQNSQNCDSNKLKLEIIYECENEKIKKKEEIPIDLNSEIPIKIKLECPINKDNEDFEGKCISIYDYKNSTNNDLIDINKSSFDCSNPIYKIPRIVDNPSNYKKLKHKKSQLEIKEYDNEIENTIENLKILKAKKYIQLKRLQTGETLSYEQAYNIVSNQLNTFSVDNKENWKIFKNYDAIQYLFNNPASKSAIKLFGKVYTLDEAVRVANDNDESYFVWYHNNYELKDFASQLYFIDIFSVDVDLFDKNNWVKHDNVTTAILKIENYDNYDNILADEVAEKETEVLEEEGKNDDYEYTKKLVYSYDNLLKNLTKSNLNNVDYGENILKKLNKNITTSGQVIEMNNHEIKINNKIIKVLQIILIFVFSIFIIVIVYYSNYFGKIKANNE